LRNCGGEWGSNQRGGHQRGGYQPYLRAEVLVGQEAYGERHGHNPDQAGGDERPGQPYVWRVLGLAVVCVVHLDP
jgi:hypothetical protein